VADALPRAAFVDLSRCGRFTRLERAAEVLWAIVAVEP
jgi:hypothetical protein